MNASLIISNENLPLVEKEFSEPEVLNVKKLFIGCRESHEKIYDRTLSGLAVLTSFVGLTALALIGLFLLKASTIDHGRQELSCKFICPIGFGMFAAISALGFATLICTCGFQFCQTFREEAR